MEDKKVLLSIDDLHVKFRVRGRILTAIRGISLDIYENESIAIVGESGSGKSVFTKTFAGMLDSNGFISEGQIIFDDDDLSDTVVSLKGRAKSVIENTHRKLNEYSKLEAGAATYKEMLELESEKRHRATLSEAEQKEFDDTLKALTAERTNAFNYKQTLDSSKEKAEVKKTAEKINALDKQIKELKKANDEKIKAHTQTVKNDTAYNQAYDQKMAALKERYTKETSGEVSQNQIARNLILAKEIYLSVGRYDYTHRMSLIRGLLKSLKKAMQLGVNLDDEAVKNQVFDEVAFRVRYLDETEEQMHGVCRLNLANVKYYKDWAQIRGKKIATVFQDPMTSLNPIITIGKQITSIILKHQKCSESDARKRALDLMHKVGIPNAEARFDDYPFQYSGGMRQRIVIAIALSCQPKILICDEPTTALDVTIQAQILNLLKDLQKEFGYTMYAGQIIELASVDELFEDPRHPYTWALLSSLPQLAQRNTTLYSITGTPPSLYNNIIGDAFAPRNPYCLKIDTLEEPPMFKVTDTHYAKTWLLHPSAPKIEKPEAIQNIHQKLIDAFNI